MTSFLLCASSLLTLCIFFFSPINCQITCLSQPLELEWTAVTSETHPFLKGIFSGSLTFDAKVITIPDNNVRWSTRLFGGSLPGPTMRMKRGYEYRLTFTNNLGPESSANPTIMNVARDPNTTNIHTHGLHISGQEPGDSPYINISPGESHEYIWTVPCDHSGGVHAYHSHHHGSTEAHVAGGAAGLIIVEDDKDQEGLPDWYTDMTEFSLIIFRVHFPRIQSIFNTSVDRVFSFDRIARGGLDRTFELLNGEYQPTICLNSNEWTKLRIAHVDAVNPGYFIFDAVCDLQLLTRDGVIIHGENNDAVPRQLSNVVWLTQLGRADIAIYCPGDPSGDISYTIYRNETFDGGRSTAVEIIGYLHVSGTDTSPTSPQSILSSFSPVRPSYLSNLLNIPRSDLLTTTVRVGRRNNFVEQDWIGIGIGNSAFNQVPFVGPTTYMYEMPIDSIVEFVIANNGIHALHMHVNPMQILVNEVSNLVPDGFQERGDFVDVFHNNGVVRWQADTWGGKIVLHCHILKHEDEGAMTTLWINGGCDYDYNTSMNVTAGACSPDYSLCSS